MPRPLRIHLEGALYYVTCRAIEPNALFRDAKDYDAYLDLLKEYRAKYRCKLFAFVLLSDHLHLCLQPTSAAPISTIMHALNSRYTKYFNRRYGHAGHLFQERFKSTVLEKAPSLLRLTGYLHAHPLRHGVTDDLRGYRWSSYLSYLTSVSEINAAEAQEVMEHLAAEHPGTTYEQYVVSMPAREWDAMHAALQQRAVGSDAFLSMIAQRLRAPSAPSGQPRLAPVLPVARPGPAVTPRPVARPAAERSHSSLILTGSLAVGFLSLCTATLYDRNLMTLKRTVQALEQERALLFNGGSAEETSGAQLATFSPAVHLTGVGVDITVRPMMGVSAASAQQDHLEFRGGRLTSRQLGAHGFFPSRYTVSRQNQRAVVWEAIQTDTTGAIASWRGEWDGQTIHGVLSRQEPGQPAAHFNFVGAVTAPGQPTSEI